MTSRSTTKLTRRELLKASVIAGGTLLVGFDNIAWPEPLPGQLKDAFAGGKQLGVVPFAREASVQMDAAVGTELDGRLFTDLSQMAPENGVTPTEKFYIRTRASQLLPDPKAWAVRVGGLVEKPFALSIEDLKRRAKPAGLHLMECAGNTRTAHFGLMSVADWAGVPVSEILDNARAKSEATRVLISGFDRYATPSVTSVPGASWIFTAQELKSARAFLATEMNGSPLTRDHGAPIRLVAPGWYGCTCIKWVDEIALVDDTAEATSQMQEYAARTMQTGVPGLAKDYRPATIDQAAMPIRIEKWSVDGKIKYRVVGILWGGSQPIQGLEIRFNPEEDYVRVDSVEQTANDPWSFWTHAWSPKKPGTYIIRLRVKDSAVMTRRLDSGFYVRSVEIAEV